MKKTNYYEIARKKLKYLNYANTTIETYCSFIQRFLDETKLQPSRIKGEDIQSYVDQFPFSSRSQQNQVISALKVFYEKVLERKYLKVNFERPRRERHLPQVIDQELILSKIDKIKNLKHKAILALTYSVALRVSEVINLKIEHIDSSRNQILIHQAKGRKDRIVPLSKNILEILRAYFKAYKPNTYLFNGQFELKYSATSCRNIIKKYISHSMKFHGLRHSCATHLIENGADVTQVQKLLGHKSSKTTEIYIHISQKNLQGLPLPI